jgi:hypothetical protein
MFVYSMCNGWPEETRVTYYICIHCVLIGWPGFHITCMNRICTPYMTVYLVISLPKIPLHTVYGPPNLTHVYIVALGEH